MGRLAWIRCRGGPAGALLLAGGLFAMLASAPGAAGVAARVLFGTTCAQCHEGQCSGRLSFDSGQTAAVAHIRRYAGAVPGATTDELFALLRHMKEHCAYLAPTVPVPADGHWDRRALHALALPSRRAYFVPLGALSTGRYRLHLSAAATAQARVEVISACLELVLEASPTWVAGSAQMPLTIEEPGIHFLRIDARAPLPLETLDLRLVP